MLAINEELNNRYRIKRRLGEGGMGAVYEAEDTKRFGKSVALKEILIDFTKTHDTKQQEILRRAFEREAKILTQLDYEAFPQVIDYFNEIDRQYLVMELIQGDDLEHQLRKRKKPFSLEEVIDLACQLLEALDYLHTLSPPIIHRDIKPQNIKMTSRGKIKLLDFGIAKGFDNQFNTTVTNQTFIAATLHYSPFEQLFRVIDENFRDYIIEKYHLKKEIESGLDVDARSDIYALGATLYHLLTGQLPIDSLKRSLELWSKKTDMLPAPITLNEEIPIEISNWILKAMALKRDERFASSAEMQQNLEKALASQKLQIEEDTKKQEWLREQRLLQEEEFLRKERARIEEERKSFDEAKASHLRQVEELRQKTRENEQSLYQDAERFNKTQKLSVKQPKLAVTKPSINQQSYIEAALTQPSLTEPIVSALSRTGASTTEPSFKQSKIGYFQEKSKPEPPRKEVDIDVEIENKPVWFIPLIVASCLVVAITGIVLWEMMGDPENTNISRSTNTFPNQARTNEVNIKSNTNSNVIQTFLNWRDYFKKGEECNKNKDYNCAIENFTYSIKLNSKNASAFNNRGFAFFNKKDYPNAIADYSKAIELNPKNIIYYQNRLAVYETQGDIASAQNERQIIQVLQRNK